MKTGASEAHSLGDDINDIGNIRRPPNKPPSYKIHPATQLKRHLHCHNSLQNQPFSDRFHPLRELIIYYFKMKTTTITTKQQLNNSATDGKPIK